MAAITGTAVVLVTAYTLVIVVGLWIGVTAQTTERSVIPAGMAVNTLIPLILVLSGENREVHAIVVKGGRHPGCFVVTIGAGRRESHRLVRRIVGSIVIGLVTTNTCGRRVIGEIAVTGCTTD